MKYLNTLLILLLFTHLAWSQETTEQKAQQEELPKEVEETRKARWGLNKNNRNDNDEIQTLSGRVGHNGGFGAISLKASEFDNKALVMMGFRGGWIINRAVAIGLEGYGVVPSSEYQGIDPFQDVRLLGGYGGLFIEPIIWSNKVIHFTFPISSGAGWLGYHSDWEDNNFNNDDLIDDDVFWYIEPGITAEVNLARNIRLGLGVTQRFTQDLQLSQTSSDAFDGTNFVMTLKIGSF